MKSNILRIKAFAVLVIIAVFFINTIAFKIIFYNIRKFDNKLHVKNFLKVN